MVKATNKLQRIWLLTPVFGIFLFACLYIVATFFYPGGSQLDKATKGFSWTQNYWCNLLNETAINGQPNRARSIALTALVILCFALALFWYLVPQQMTLPKRLRKSIQVFGGLSMATCAFLFTGFHDLVINAATGLGLIAIAGMFAALKKLKWTRLLWAGVFNIVLVVLNNILYYGEGLRYYLPVVQKITFLFFLLWCCRINLKMYAHRNTTSSDRA